MNAQQRVGITMGLYLVGICLTGGEFFSAAGQASDSGNKSKNALRPGATESSSLAASKSRKEKVLGTAVSPSAPETDSQVYRIGVEDELLISVWHEPELSLGVVVRPDGVITLPLVNEVQVVGLTPKELQAVLTDKLKPFVNSPEVSVIPRQIRSRKVYLVGEIGRQGAFPLNGTKTVLELLAEAGGLGQFAKSESIYILRRRGGQQVRIPFNYKKAISGQNSKADIVLVPGDVIVVP